MTHSKTQSNTQPQLQLPVSNASFLADYWQRKPLLCPGSLPAYTSPLSGAELAGLALEEDVEARLIKQQGDTWSVQHSPLTEQDFLETPEQNWTLLVQAVDLWVPEVAELKGAFNFLPAWRLDDIMISYAAPGGSVGPHFDHYDVFLLQTEGCRRWQIGAPCAADAPLREDSELRLLEDFAATEEYLLEPGDMLYLPPRVPHWGVAQDECLTFSIGFRAPTLVEMLDDLIIDLIGESRDAYFQDPPLQPHMATDRIDPTYVAQARALLSEVLEDEDRLGAWLARYMTAPKYPELTAETGESRRATWAGQQYINGHAASASDLEQS